MKGLKTGMYVRFKNGDIDKIEKIEKISNYYDIIFKNEFLSNSNNEDYNIVKAKDNITDLIDIEDYINGKKWIYTDSNYKFGILENEIETVMTKEYFENNCYKVVWK